MSQQNLEEVLKQNTLLRPSRRSSRTPDTVERAFRDAYFTPHKRIELFLSLPHQSLDARCAEIGAA